MDSSAYPLSDKETELSAEGVGGVTHPSPASSPNSGISPTGSKKPASLCYQKPKGSLYPALHREVLFVSRKYKCLAGGKKHNDIEYRKIEIEHNIPSFVELPKKKCENKQSFKVVCADCGYEDMFISGGCDDPKCFICHVKWSKEQAHDAALRLMAGLEKVEKAGLDKTADDDDDDDDFGLWHFTLSPPENANNCVTPRDESYIDKVLKECYDLCRSNGILGGCAIVHYGPELGDKGIPKYLPEGEYRPHLHVFGFGKRPQGPWKNGKRTWICKTLNNGKAVERNFSFIRDGLHYQLSHAMRRKGKHSIRWFGAFSYNKGLGDKNKLVELGLERKWIEKVKRMGSEVVCKCPKCKGDMVRGTVFDSNGGVFVDIKGPPS